MHPDMTPEKLLTLFKYYHQEEICPFERPSNSALWWYGEKWIHNHCVCHPDFFQKFRDDLINAIANGHCTGPLVDETLSLDQRTIIFILDLWHGKWFPYDEFDVIFSY